jgi:DNA repair protein RecO
MGYSVYTSEGIVIARTVVAEASVVARILTDEYGVITFRAENGARSAKFAPSIQIGTLGRYDFVRSKAGFRLVGISPIAVTQARDYSADAIRFVRMCCVYIARFVPSDEGVVEGLYELLVQAHSYARNHEWSSNWWNSFRLQALQLLGYIASDGQSLPRSELEQLLSRAEFEAQL